jgi:peptidoglycan/xylan/chitin deacetylase (PgdA/CDA1 family)
MAAFLEGRNDMWFLVFLGLLAPTYVFLSYLFIKYHERRWRRWCLGKLFLTYDDGPGEVLQPALLTLLESYQVRATFFLLGRNVKKYPERARQIAAAGHALGSHTQHHRRIGWLFPRISYEDARAGIQTLHELGIDSRLYRAPFGEMPLLAWLLVRNLGITLVPWTISPDDRMKKNRPVPEVLNELRRLGGGVVLMHSHDCGPTHGRFVLETTERLIECARGMGLEILPIPG